MENTVGRLVEITYNVSGVPVGCIGKITQVLPSYMAGVQLVTPVLVKYESGDTSVDSSWEHRQGALREFRHTIGANCEFVK